MNRRNRKEWRRRRTGVQEGGGIVGEDVVLTEGVRRRPKECKGVQGRENTRDYKEEGVRMEEAYGRRRSSKGVHMKGEGVPKEYIGKEKEIKGDQRRRST